MDFRDTGKPPIKYTYTYLKGKSLASRKVDSIGF